MNARLNNQLRGRLELAGRTVKDLAAVWGCTPQAAYKKLNGVNRMTVSEAVAYLDLARIEGDHDRMTMISFIGKEEPHD